MDAFICQPQDSATPEQEAQGALSPAAVAPFQILAPAACVSPLVFASPHSGRHYPDDLGAALSRARLRRLEDALVDQLVDHAPAHGAPLLMASYGRAYVDLNRDPVELDAEMLSDPLPPASRRRTARVAAGLGVIAKRVDGHEIYDRRLALQ